MRGEFIGEGEALALPAERPRLRRNGNIVCGRHVRGWPQEGRGQRHVERLRHINRRLVMHVFVEQGELIDVEIASSLFRSGEPYSRRLLEETERNLRELSFLREPRVRPVRFRDGVVDVEVETHDVWTLQLGPSFGRSGGENHSSVSFEDSNLLGRGKTLILEVSQDVDRDATSFEWRDPNILGGRWQNLISWSDATDGPAARLAV